MSATQSLKALLAGMTDAPEDVFVTDVTLDSRQVTPGSLFLACRGRAHHGLQFAAEAVARGARAVVYEPHSSVADPPDLTSGVFVASLPELRHRAGMIADRFFDMPSKALTVAGVTGTNGKTTTAYLLAQTLTLCGRKAGYLGTLGVGLPGQLAPSSHTTLDAVSVQRELAVLRSLGATAVTMEVSSHALDQSRVNGVRFHTAVFTNLTRDHLDYHGDMDAYGAAKARLFDWPSLKWRVINIDDSYGAELATHPSSARLVATTQASAPRKYGTRFETGHRDQFVYATEVEARRAGLAIDIESSFGAGSLDVPLIGDFNVENVLAVLGVLLAWEIPFAEAAAALARCQAPSGRMEVFGGRNGLPLVIVDYAHTPDALAKVLEAARMHGEGDLHVVFGCGGNRDTGKRPMMGHVAAQYADAIVLTDDNPRDEDPVRIVADIRAGMRGARRLTVEHDRARAISVTLEQASPDDVVIIAGKGHEDYQIYGQERRAFSDQAVVREQLGKRACSAR